MKLVVASGKGGTGKTTVATNLAVTLARHGQKVAYGDCDVEAPNGHLILKPVVTRESPVGRLVPRVNQERCLLCGLCAPICRFNAFVRLPDQTLVYDALCHSCGGCAQVCPAGAITEVSHPIGVLKTGATGAIHFISGTLNAGETTSPPIIRAAKHASPPAEWIILDAPPGTACPMMETVRDAPDNARVSRTYRVDPSACEGCGVCHYFCAVHAIELIAAEGGEWFVSDTSFGPLVHARLLPGQGNSGKLVTLVREQARQVADATGRQLILIDSPPGIGCPVIASLTAAQRRGRPVVGLDHSPAAQAILELWELIQSSLSSRAGPRQETGDIVERKEPAL